MEPVFQGFCDHQILKQIATERVIDSPLLANLYLHLLDRIWERHRLQQRLGARIVCYPDDIAGDVAGVRSG